MRFPLATVLATLALAFLSVGANAAEKRIFVIANNPDGYGVDRCLSNGEQCGGAVAAAYCRSQDFERAVSFRRVERSDITGAVPVSVAASCGGAACPEFVAIECVR